MPILRGHVAVPVDEVLVGDRLVEQEVEEQHARGRGSSAALATQRKSFCTTPLAPGPPEGEDVRWNAGRHVVERAGEEVARPRVVQVHRPFGQRLVVGDRDLDVADVGELLEVGRRPWRRSRGPPCSGRGSSRRSSRRAASASRGRRACRRGGRPCPSTASDSQKMSQGTSSPGMSTVILSFRQPIPSDQTT